MMRLVGWPSAPSKRRRRGAQPSANAPVWIGLTVGKDRHIHPTPVTAEGT
jgi:hypothetical protein